MSLGFIYFLSRFDYFFIGLSFYPFSELVREVFSPIDLPIICTRQRSDDRLGRLKPKRSEVIVRSVKEFRERYMCRITKTKTPFGIMLYVTH